MMVANSQDRKEPMEIAFERLERGLEGLAKLPFPSARFDRLPQAS